MPKNHYCHFVINIMILYYHNNDKTKILYPNTRQIGIDMLKSYYCRFVIDIMTLRYSIDDKIKIYL